MEQRSHIPNTFDSLVSWLGIISWQDVAQYALRNGGVMNGSDFVEAEPVAGHGYLSPSRALGALRLEYLK
jgi:hypothetical protein